MVAAINFPILRVPNLYNLTILITNTTIIMGYFRNLGVAGSIHIVQNPDDDAI